jgi:hypothetical protein
MRLDQCTGLTQDDGGWTVTDVPGPGPSKWRFCTNCNGMYFDGYPTKGACPMGRTHTAAGFNFVLEHKP